jgi:hypothetical protein
MIQITRRSCVARALDQIIVVDVESTCWEGPPPNGEESEIIEIGLCTLNIADGARLDRRSIIVRPERSRVSAYCMQLTSITQSQVDEVSPSRRRASWWRGITERVSAPGPAMVTMIAASSSDSAPRSASLIPSDQRISTLGR